MVRLLVTGLLAATTLWGCALRAPASGSALGQGGSAGPDTTFRYRCEHGLDFSVRFTDESALLDGGTRGSEELLRDAGGVTPQQTVYSNAHLRAEFGLGAAGQGAMLRYVSPPLVAHCMRD